MVGVKSRSHSQPGSERNRPISPFDPFLAVRKVLPDNSFVHRVAAIALIFAFFVASAKAVRELVVIEEPQPARRVEGVVLDPSGAPIPT